MEESIIHITGPEDEVRIFHQELLAYLSSRRGAAEGIEVSDPEPVKPGLIDRAPLGHLPLMVIAVKVGVALLKDVGAPVAVGVLKEWIMSRVKQSGLKVQEGKRASRTKHGK
jgi:hypothetical protein